MSVPVLLVTGFLGAGKTTLINRLLHDPQGRRLAAIVNDFGAIDIDAALLGGDTGGVVSLKNGCICCTLQGDLLSTLRTILRRDPVPDAIVIETSGVSDPAEIVRALMDPVIWAAAPLDTVLCVADARHLADRPALYDEPLCRSQFTAADFIALSKGDLMAPWELAQVHARLRTLKPDRSIYDMLDGVLPPELLFSGAMPPPGRGPARPGLAASAVFQQPAFESLSWQSDAPLVPELFHAVIGRFADRLMRAKGVVTLTGQPGRQLMFQLAGTRATLAPASPGIFRDEIVRLVFISRRGELDGRALVVALEGCRAPRQQGHAA